MDLREIRRLLKGHDDGILTEGEVIGRIFDHFLDVCLDELDKGVDWTGMFGSWCGSKPLPPRRAIVTRHANSATLRRVGSPEIKQIPMDRTYVYDEFQDVSGFLTEAEKLVFKLRDYKSRLGLRLRQLWDDSAPYNVHEGNIVEKGFIPPRESPDLWDDSGKMQRTRED